MPRAVVRDERLAEAWLRSSPVRCGINEDGDEANPMERRDLKEPRRRGAGGGWWGEARG